MLAFFAKVSTWQLEEPTTQLAEIQDTQHAFLLVSCHTDSSATLVVIIDPQWHPWCPPHKFQVSD